MRSMSSVFAPMNGHAGREELLALPGRVFSNLIMTSSCWSEPDCRRSNVP